MRLVDITGNTPNIASFKDCESVPADRLIGVEIELEKWGNEVNDLKYWRLEHDGSLRNNGIEFVLRQPLTGLDLQLAAQEAEDAIRQSNPEANHRCSTHIHVDVRDFTTDQVSLMTMVYGMFEKMLFNYVGGDREHNFYCMPMYNSLDNRMNISKSLASHSYGNTPKYSAINLRPIMSFGSIEFRMHQAVMTADEIVEWARIIQRIAMYAKANDGMTLEDALNQYSEGGAQDLFYEVFAEDAHTLLAGLSFNSLQQELEQCLHAAQDLIVLNQSPSAGMITKLAEDNEALEKLGNKCMYTIEELKSALGTNENVLDDLIQWVMERRG